VLVVKLVFDPIINLTIDGWIFPANIKSLLI